MPAYAGHMHSMIEKRVSELKTLSYLTLILTAAILALALGFLLRVSGN